MFAWWVTLRPSNDRVWADDVARTASGTVEGDHLMMRNVRNFIWHSDSDYEPRWETRSYDLNALTGVDLLMSYWAGELIAHAIVSFGFADGQHLAFSIEIRKEKTETYSALAGFFARMSFHSSPPTSVTWWVCGQMYVVRMSGSTTCA